MSFLLHDRIQETTASTGTGDVSLDGPVAGFRAFSTRYSVGDTLYYAIYAVDNNGVPSGAWEVGVGTYSAANTLSRTSVLESSYADALISFTAGTKRVMVAMPALQGRSIRERLNAPRTYYVRSDGSDNNTGLADTSGGAFEDIGYAVTLVAKTLDLNGQTVTIQVGAGTRTSSLQLHYKINGFIRIIGDETTPSNCTMSVSVNSCVVARDGVQGYFVGGFKFITTGWGYGVQADGPATEVSTGIVEYGTCVSGHIYSGRGASVVVGDDYTISGGAPTHVEATAGGAVDVSDYIGALSGTPAFGTAFFSASSLARIDINGGLFTGSATGVRFAVSSNAVIDTHGEAGTFLPGSSAGTETTGGVYV